MKEKARRNKGISVVEVVITMVILALVVAVVMPALQNIQLNIKDATVKGALGELRAAIQAYSAAEIAAGRSSRFATGTAAGWPTVGQINEAKYGGTNAVLPDKDVPENPYAKSVFTRDFDKIIASTGSPGSEAVSALFERGAAYAVMMFESGGEGGGGGVPPGLLATGWRYNENTGQIWASTGVHGENQF